MCPATSQSTAVQQQQQQPPPYIINPPPQTQHTHTAVLLHGRGSNGEEFAEEFFASTLSHSQKTLREMLPGWRWVFPSSSQELWSSTYQEHMPMWFDAYSLIDPTARQELQVDGLIGSIRDVESILDEELRLLDNQASRLVLGGISQGGAVALWVLLRQCRQLTTTTTTRLGGFMGASTWLPFAKECRQMLLGSADQDQDQDDMANGKESEFMSFVRKSTTGTAGTTSLAKTEHEHEHEHEHEAKDLLPTSQAPVPAVFMGHGVDDAYVNVDLGREATKLLSMAGFKVQRKEYRGAELEGHWLKIPEQIDDIYDFLMNF